MKGLHAQITDRIEKPKMDATLEVEPIELYEHILYCMYPASL